MARRAAFDGRLLALITAVPAGDKLPMAAFARTLGSAQGEVIAMLSMMVSDGQIDAATMRPPVEAPGRQPSPSSARGQQPTPRGRRSSEGDTEGRAVIAEIKPYLAATGLAPTIFVKRAINDTGAWKRWKENRLVRATTVAKVRAFIVANPVATSAGQPSPGPTRTSSGPSGTELLAEIRAFVESSDELTLSDFARLLGRNAAGIANIAKAHFPKPATVDRVRAIIAGDRAEYAPFVVKPTTTNAHSLDGADERRTLSQAGVTGRRPGEALADAVAREAQESSRRRSRAFKPHPDAVPETSRERFARLAAEVEAELNSDEAIARDARENRELDELVSPSSVLRRAQRDWPGQCDRVKAIAAELGVGLGEAWRRVIGAGVDCLSEADA